MWEKRKCCQHQIVVNRNINPALQFQKTTKIEFDDSSEHYLTISFATASKVFPPRPAYSY